MNLTEEQQKALTQVRAALYERLECYDFTKQMLESRSIHQLLCLLQLVAGHRNWIGHFTHTLWALDQIFGFDAIHEEPKIEPEKAAMVN